MKLERQERLIEFLGLFTRRDAIRDDQFDPSYGRYPLFLAGCFWEKIHKGKFSGKMFQEHHSRLRLN